MVTGICTSNLYTEIDISRRESWKISWTEEPGRLPSMGSQRVGHDWMTSLHFRRESTAIISYLPSLYTQKTLSDIHNPPGPDAHHSVWPSVAKKKPKRVDISDRYVIPESGGYIWQWSEHCKSAILQHNIGMILKRRKKKQCLLYSSRLPCQA